MKKAIIAMFAVVAFAGSALAADSIDFAAPKKGKVTFNHKAHQGRAKCADCHGDKPGKIEGFNKDAAHGKACKDCHKKNGSKTGCNDCHQK